MLDLDQSTGEPDETFQMPRTPDIRLRSEEVFCDANLQIALGALASISLTWTGALPSETATAYRTAAWYEARAFQAEAEKDVDSLSELPNRRAFTDRLTRLANSDAVLLIDIDDFKSLNDHEDGGHWLGDDVIGKVKIHLETIFRGNNIDLESDDEADATTPAESENEDDADIEFVDKRSKDHRETEDEVEVFRLGGDEFAVILSEADRRNLKGIIERINKEPMRVAYTKPDGKGPYLARAKMSCVGSRNDTGSSVEIFLSHLDRTLYEQKRQNNENGDRSSEIQPSGRVLRRSISEQ